MSVVIIGGHDRMVCQYKKICKSHKCKAKQIGDPDLCILFTNTVSHKMVRCAVDEAEKKKFKIVRCHTSSGSALEGILLEHAV